MKTNTLLKLKNVNFSKSRFQTYFGNIGEMIAEETLFKEGFEVCKWSSFSAPNIVPNKINNNLRYCLMCLYIVDSDEGKVRIGENEYVIFHVVEYKKIMKQLKSFFADKLGKIKDYIDFLGIFDPNKKPLYIPDLVAKKDKEIFVIEVKTNSGNIYRKRQKEKLEGLLSARTYDFIPMLVNLKVEIVASAFTLTELE